MKVWKKFSAIALTLVMALALCAPTFASGNDPAALDEGKVGNYTTADTQNLDNKKVDLKKEITVYNPTESLVYGPAITYTYAIAAATGDELTTVTDDASLHSPAQAVTKTALPGVTTDVTMTGTSANTIAWTNADILDASATGTANYKNLTIDFSAVVFSEPGIYRYKITESATYTVNGVTETSVETNKHVRYLDVYVMRSTAYTPIDGTTKTVAVAGDWKIYGYVCVPDTTAITTETTTKTNGFVNSADSGSNADQYHTYNLTVSKTLSGDTTMNSHKFPFDVSFANSALTTGTFQLIAKPSSGTAEVATNAQSATTTVNGTEVAANTLYQTGTAATIGAYDITNLGIANSGSVKFIGIPNGTTVTVTETNDVAGTTYTTSATQKTGTSTTIATATATAVAFDSSSTGTRFGTGDSANKSISIDPSDTAVYLQSTAPASGEDVVIAFTNQLSLISPTGVTLRYAPYLAMMGAGIVALPLSLRKKEELF